MDKIIVYIDDAAHALQQLTPMKTGGPVASSLAQARQPIQVTQWILVACPPRMTQHINKWVNHSAREKWRAKWSEKVLAQIAPTLTTQGDLVVPLVAKGTLTTLTDRLLAEHGPARVLDARRARLGQDLPPITRDQPTEHDSRWSLPGAVAGMGALLVLASD
jgi:hypothetical protein